jgi:glutathione S-transferase
MLKLYIGNKNYSSWSMRPWVLLRQIGIPFEEVMVRFDDMQAGSPFKQTMASLTPTGNVPLLVDGGLAVWDSLAIAEYVVEYAARHLPGKAVWPQDTAARARARSVCAEFHSGFGALRNLCGMNIEAHLPEQGQIALRDHPQLGKDLARIIAMWSELLQQHGGPMLFGTFSAADAFFAPVCMRINTYALPVPPAVADYVARVTQLDAVQAWIKDALAEQDFVVFDEPYRARR